MSTMYLTGDSIPIKITVTDEDGPVTPSVATVTITRVPVGTVLVTNAAMTITANVLTYTLAPSDTSVASKYKFVIKITLASGVIAQFVTTKVVDAL